MKFIITGRLPSGFKFALSGVDKKFALVPVDENNGGMVRGAFAWDTQAEAERYLDAQLEAAPDLDEKLGPFKIELCELPS